MKNFFANILMAAVLVCFVSTVYAGEKVNDTINLAGNRSVTWYLPDTTPVGWVFLQHGFNRNKDNLVDLATHWMNNGFIVLTANCSVTKGNASLARSIADVLVDNPPIPPNGFVLPDKLILSGHSAGGLFVCYMGGRLASRSYTSLKGLILLDPVDANNGMSSNMQAVVDFGRPVIAVLAKSSSCNSSNNALPLLRNLRDSFVGIYLTDGSTHSDAEGASTGGVITLLCGSPKPHNVSYVKEFTSHWAIDMASGSHTSAYYPGGSVMQNLMRINDGVLIKEINTQECGNGIVENGEECDGGSCCDRECYFISAGTVCRSADGECDVAETCTGRDASCPEDINEDDGATCSVGVCQGGQCVAEGNIAPKADFSFSTSELTVYFTDDSSDDDGNIYSYSWDFGDGETSTDKDPTHVYSGEGTYSVTLTVIDNEGATGSVTRNVSLGKMQCGASPVGGSSIASGSSLRNALMPLLPALIVLFIWGFVRRFNLEKYFAE